MGLFDELVALDDPKAALKAAKDIHKVNKINLYYPDSGPLRRELYTKHTAVFAAGSKYRVRAVIAGNRVGKSEGIGCYETVLHLTGRYPDWWTGHRFDHAIKAWVAGDTSKTVKEILQDKLLGKYHEQGTGLIPKELIVHCTPKAGIPEAIDTIHVRHTSGGISSCILKSFDQKRESFQGTEQDWILLDEEPDEGIFVECAMRTMATTTFPGGKLLLTFTPVNGWSQMVDTFLTKEKRDQGNFFVQQLGWRDAPHLSEKERNELEAMIPPYQRQARMEGVPELGSGAIYPVDESEIVIPPIPIPNYWPRGYGLDVGSKVAIVWIAYDRLNDTIYVIDEYFSERQEPSSHVMAVKMRGDWIPGWCDPSASQSSQLDGRKFINEYKKLGLTNLKYANNVVEAGIFNIYIRMTTGRFKIFNTCRGILEEKRTYRRNKGKIVKADDHRLDAMRYVCNANVDDLVAGMPEMPPPPKRDLFSPRNATSRANSWMIM